MELQFALIPSPLSESTETMLHKVYQEQKTSSRKGDFINLVTTDLKDLEIDMKDGDIENMPKQEWKTLVKKKIK